MAFKMNNPFKLNNDKDKAWEDMTNEERYKWFTSNKNAYDNMPGHLKRQYMDSIRKYQGSVPDSLKTKFQMDLKKHSGLKNYKKGYYGAGKSKK
jgi:membrane-bound lytic murein transglycosylase MltF